MIVKPRKKYKALRQNEIRVINIDRAAVEELLWEHLMEHLELYFDVDPVSDQEICVMEWDPASEMLTYAVMPLRYAQEGRQVDFQALRRKAGRTTSSLYQKGRYRRLPVSDALFLRDCDWS